MSSKAIWVTCAIAALALGGGYHYFTKYGLPGERPAVAATPAAERRIAIETQPVAIDTVIDDVRAVGTLQPDESVVVSSEIAGRINRIQFEEGELVAAGDVLVQLDSAILRAELTKAQSDLTLAAANRDRAMTLTRQGTGTLRARDEAVAAYQVAVANVALAKARLDKTSITAPFDGVAGLRAVSVGAYLTPGDPVVNIAKIDTIKVDFRAPELALSSLHTEQTIIVTVDALPDRTFEGIIYAIDPTVDESGRAIRLRARVANPDRILFPGLFARVRVVVARRENAVLVPESAIFAEDSDRLVYRVVDGRAKLAKVQVGQRRPGQWRYSMVWNRTPWS